jgi:hypothetical protein
VFGVWSVRNIFFAAEAEKRLFFETKWFPRFRIASEMLPKCFRNASEMLPKCFRIASELLPICFRFASDLLPICFRFASGFAAEVLPGVKGERCGEMIVGCGKGFVVEVGSVTHVPCVTYKAGQWLVVGGESPTR